MSMAVGNINLLSVAFRATEPLARKESARPTATDKDFLAVQIVSQFNYVQGKGISDDKQY
ncbi:hypothetical protein CWE08_11935 [Aliidiomarina iranensis]|uniref:Uncharacterized protein n=1 Tax=Aliidiomarina iranensis TaxID=1434071 RepID=A0A432VPN4_9GAMM|nr:hypothetical protein [Aliidiomarina iranensis]RUO18103.1 hypothetical protein CWE08_11935 [Aliidiomarina iranensis]